MKQFLNVNLLFDKEKIYTTMDNYLRKEEAQYICAINANSIAIAKNDSIFKKAVNNSGFNLCDGSLVALSYKLVYKKEAEPYPGPDFFINYLREKKYKSFFFGSTQELLDGLKNKLQKIDPEIKDMSFYSPPFLPLDEYDYESIGNMINASGADLIWISLGAPKQEIFMYNLKPYLKKGIMVGVGAAFIFYGDENFKRAPKVMRDLHMEWIYRNIKNPKKSFPRLIYQLRYVPLLILKEMFNKGSDND